MEENKKEEVERPKNLLESGEYNFLGPENGDIAIDKLILQSHSGSKRIWKVRSITPKEIIFDVEKF